MINLDLLDKEQKLEEILFPEKFTVKYLKRKKIYNWCLGILITGVLSISILVLFWC